MTEPTKSTIRYTDVAVTFTADQFQGTYRGKAYHDPDIAHVIQRAKEYGCEKLMLTTMSLPLAHENIKIVRQFPETCTMTLGVHPYHAAEIYASPEASETGEPNANNNDGREYLQELRELAKSLLAEQTAETGSPLVAFGEIGLDYEYLTRSDKTTQQRAFQEQLAIAIELQLPLFLHVRESCADFISVIKPFLPDLPRRGLVHSFAGTKEEMLELTALGFDISVNGVCFRTEEQLDMVRSIPLEKLQLETDAPWCEVLEGDENIKPYLEGARPLPGSRKHGKFRAGEMVKGRNESCTIERVAMVVAGLKGIGIEKVAKAAWENSVRMFGLGVKP
ncbi:TatD family hydrolase [Aspergillus stella-maris]|uniref:TatD family hydrolase n=1 Tax=Aspergillus stella-maris TaxID=1810926 RepID=UPI003CCCAD5D